MLGDKMQKYKVNVWLVNTGWTGGEYGVGKRMKLSYTRAMITAALEGKLDKVETESHPVFGMAIPKECPGVPGEILNPRNTWDDKDGYDEKAKYLAALFIRNFEKYAEGLNEEVKAAAPKTD
jgi:phosphoenolpyruvate carboxykinase (ATP)